MTANPILIEARRGNRRESVHRGALAVWQIGGGLALAIGDIERPIFPRSAVKALQALPLIESGAADRFGFEDRHLALACASHSGSSSHLAVVREMLDLADLEEAMLACGVHPPLGLAESRALAQSGKSARALHNNCSGKHAAILACARHRGLETAGYERPEHGVQQAIAQVLEEMTGTPHDRDKAAIDGCSVPTWPAPISGLAHAFARFVSGAELGEARAVACRRLIAACMAEPGLMAGRRRFGTSVMRRLPGQVFIKGGAEGVYCGGLPEAGIGIALKIDDGAKRAARATMAALLGVLLPKARDTLKEAWDFELRSWRGATTGEIAASPHLQSALRRIAITD